jgi:hypothetical protein
MPIWVLPLFTWAAVALVFGLFTSYVAYNKGFSRLWWLLWGALFGPLALLAADRATEPPAILKTQKKQAKEPR